MSSVQTWIPGTKLGFRYDPEVFTALVTREREYGFVRLESRCDGSVQVTIRKLNLEKVPEDISASFEIDRPSIRSEHGDLQIFSHKGDKDHEEVTWAGENTEGLRYITRKSNSCWMIYASGQRGKIAYLQSVCDQIQESIHVLDVQVSPKLDPVQVYGSLRSLPGPVSAAVIDILVGPTTHDLQIASVQIEPDPENSSLTTVFQGRQLLLFSRTQHAGRTSWGSSTVPAGGYAIIQLPQVILGPASVYPRGRVVVSGWSGGGQLISGSQPLGVLHREVTLTAPTPANWRAINGPAMVSIHRLAVSIMDGHLFAAQRGAVDLYMPSQTYSQNHMDGDVEDELQLFLSYGKPVLSPCAGEVIRVCSDLPDQPIGKRDREHSRGNEVCIRRSDGLVVVLAHLRQNSARVHEGEHINTGTVLAEVGNSGSSSEPHLHLHIADSESFLANGVLFQFADHPIIA